MKRRQFFQLLAGAVIAPTIARGFTVPYLAGDLSQDDTRAFLALLRGDPVEFAPKLAAQGLGWADGVLSVPRGDYLLREPIVISRSALNAASIVLDFRFSTVCFVGSEGCFVYGAPGEDKVFANMRDGNFIYYENDEHFRRLAFDDCERLAIWRDTQDRDVLNARTKERTEWLRAEGVRVGRVPLMRRDT